MIEVYVIYKICAVVLILLFFEYYSLLLAFDNTYHSRAGGL